MKWIISLIIYFAFTLISFAQVPQGIRYQAIVRDAEGRPLTNREVAIQFSILPQNGTPVYRERHLVATNSQGLVVLSIGSGSAAFGSFPNIDWSGGSMALRVEMDPNGGNNYSIEGIEALESVPYSLMAAAAEKLSVDAEIDPGQLGGGNAGIGQVLKWNGTAWVPADDIGGTGGGDYIAGNGISIQNNVITNTGDLDPNDDITINSQAGGDLSGVFQNLQINPGAVGSAEIAPGSINNTHLQPNSINITNLQGGVIPTALPPTGPANGDLEGTYPAPNVRALRGVPLSAQSPSDGQVLKYNAGSGTWSPGTDLVSSGGGAVNVSSRLSGDGSPALPLDISSQGASVGQVLKWNGSSWAPANDDSGTGAPSGPAGGDLSGTFPNPVIAPNSINTAKVQDAAITNNKIANATVQFEKIAQNNANVGQVIKWNGTAWVASNDDTGSTTPSGPAGGDLSGNYPNPSISNGAISTNKLSDLAVTGPKIADLAVSTSKIANNAISTEKLANASVTSQKIAQNGASNGQVLKWNGSAWAPADDNAGSGAPSGPAGGDLTGTYPNPAIANNSITSSKIASNSVETSKINDNAVTTDKLANASVTGQKMAQGGAMAGQVLKWNGSTWAPANDSVGGGSISGPAGGDLTGTYPNPTVANNSITSPKIANNSVTNEKVANNSITSSKIANNAVETSKINENAVTTDKLANASVTGQKMAQSGATAGQVLKWNGSTWAPANDSVGGGSISGPAGGDLGGSYPNPTVDRIRGRNISVDTPTTGQVLQYTTGGEWAPAFIGSGGLTLPFSGSANINGAGFSVSQSNSGGNASAISGTRGSNIGRLGTSSYSGHFSGDMLVDNGNINISKTSSGSAVNLINTLGSTWSVYNQGSLRMSRDGEDIVLINYPGAFLNPPALRPASDNILGLGSLLFRWTAVYATNGTINTSDRNLKKNIQPISYGLSTVNSMKPSSYIWIDNSDNRTHLGFIAQDLHHLIPEAVYIDEASNTYGVSYTELIPVLVKAIQELSEKVEQLQKQLPATASQH